MIRISLFLFALFIANFSFSQTQNLKIKLSPKFDKQAFELEKTYQFNDSEISFETLKFYISHLKFLKENEPVWQEPSSFRLIDLSLEASLKWALEMPAELDFDKIQFKIGIDSLTHEAGVMGGDLDPTKGMYWSWNTGYINFKLEGESELSKARDKSFQYHLGGYMPPFQTVQIVELPFSKEGENVLEMDIFQFLKAVDLAEEHTVMSPGENAKMLSKVVANLFYFK